MAVTEKQITERYAAYNGDCIEVLAELPTSKVHFSVYSPPFAGLYIYSSDARDISNNSTREKFLEHYGFVVKELHRVTMPGRLTAVHCSDIPNGNKGRQDSMYDLPGDIVRLHELHGWHMVARHMIWKEPLAFRNRTMTKSLSHQTTVIDAANAGVAAVDQLIVFRKGGANPVPIEHPTGFHEYAGESQVPAELERFRGWTGNQIENRYSHWIWRQYASGVWDDIRLARVLPYKEARDHEDEKHVHPLQLDVIERAITLRSNPGETVLTPFMGVGSEAYSAVRLGRKAIGIELKPSYYRQALKNLEMVDQPAVEQMPLLEDLSEASLEL